MNVDNVDNVESTWRIKLCATAKNGEISYIIAKNMKNRQNILSSFIRLFLMKSWFPEYAHAIPQMRYMEFCVIIQKQSNKLASFLLIYKV